MDDFGQFCKEIKRILEPERVIIDPDLLGKETENTLGLKRSIKAVLYAMTTSEIQQIVELANQFDIPLYPISQGKNIGYGDKIPPSDNQIIVDLSFGFEFPLTMTLVEPDKIIGVLSICFDKNDPAEKERAYQLYEALHQQFEKEDLFPYWNSILGLKHLHFVEDGKEETLKELKALFDPKNIIAPGRYGINSK